MNGLTLQKTDDIIRTISDYARQGFVDPMQQFVIELVMRRGKIDDRQVVRTVVKMVLIMTGGVSVHEFNANACLPSEYRGMTRAEILDYMVVYATERLHFRRPTWLWASIFLRMCASASTLQEIQAEIDGQLWRPTSPHKVARKDA